MTEPDIPMDARNAASAYRESAFENAPPIKIVRLLYQGALRFLEQAEQHDPGQTGSRFAYYVMRADAVVTELRLALDKSPAPGVSENLEQLYFFVEERLRRALRERSKAPLAEARTVLVDLLEAWQHVEVGARQGG